MALHCPECGFVNPEGANFCQKCGAPLELDAGGEPTTATYRIGETGDFIPVDIADIAADGADLDTLEARAYELIPRTSVYGAVENLEHLEKGGRIGGARAMIGSLLSIKPVVTLVDGEVAEESKQRTRGRSLQYLADKILSSPPLSRVGIAHGAATDIDVFLALLDDLKSEHPLMVSQLGPVVGTHTGPGTIGVCMVLAG